jgi:predicted transposase YbfD/YdcC
MFRRLLPKLDADTFDALLGAWVQRCTAPAGQRRRHVAVDGKPLRGGGTQGPAGESPRLPALLATLELAGAVVTADAAHPQRATATCLHTRGAHYVLTVTGNQPTLLSQLKALPWKQVPVGARTRDRAHGRAETRTVKVVCVRAGIGFPHAAQAV